jgi:hypothetical protein
VFEGKFVGKEYHIIFNLFIQMLGLIDLPLLGRKFTLFNRMVDAWAVWIGSYSHPNDLRFGVKLTFGICRRMFWIIRC